MAWLAWIGVYFIAFASLHRDIIWLYYFLFGFF
jgi:hypothetical protein